MRSIDAGTQSCSIVFELIAIQTCRLDLEAVKRGTHDEGSKHSLAQLCPSTEYIVSWASFRASLVTTPPSSSCRLKLSATLVHHRAYLVTAWV
eukprot:1689492-Pleurochrysis_carterae.AAC.2